jgi:ATP-dependent Clp protease ATP-binding subunit ClpB
MNLNRLTEKAQEAVVAAQQLATRSNHSQIDPEHLLSTLVGQQGGIVPSVLRKMQIDPAALARTIDAACARSSTPPRRKPRSSRTST